LFVRQHGRHVHDGGALLIEADTTEPMHREAVLDARLLDEGKPRLPDPRRSKWATALISYSKTGIAMKAPGPRRGL
jgi:hypothetical protein